MKQAEGMSAERNSERMDRAFHLYRERVLPQDISNTQLIETRRAFYAGAWALLTELSVMFDAGSEPTESDHAKMVSIEAELKRFNDRVKVGLA